MAAGEPTIKRRRRRRFSGINSPSWPTRNSDFLGVWDTVDAVGLPLDISDVINGSFYRFKFPDLHAHAHRPAGLSGTLDRRPAGILQPGVVGASARATRRGSSQVWFAGVHSNVGGGYPRQGLSLVALDWMLRRSAPCRRSRTAASSRTIEGRSASTRASTTSSTIPGGNGVFYRWKIRDIALLCADHGVVPKVHVSVLERVAHGTDDYAPGNVPGSARVIITPPSNFQHYDLAEQRALNVQNVLKTLPSESLLSGVRSAIATGVLSYYVYLVSCTVAILEASRLSAQSLFTDSGLALSTAGTLAWTLLTRPGDTVTMIALRLWQEPRLTTLIAAGFAAAYVLSLIADRRMSAFFSDAWFTKQTELRDALRRAREDVARAPSQV